MLCGDNRWWRRRAGMWEALGFYRGSREALTENKGIWEKTGKRFPGGTEAKNPPANPGDTGFGWELGGVVCVFRSLGQEDPLEEEIGTNSSILAWKIPCTEELGGLQSTGSQGVRHDWATEHTLKEEREELCRYLVGEHSRQRSKKAFRVQGWGEKGGGGRLSNRASQAIVRTLAFIPSDVGNTGTSELRNDMIWLIS